jgi:probable F420-dependent oxidoreductase
MSEEPATMTGRPRVGLRPAVWLAPGEDPFQAQLGLTREAERRGFDGVFFGDRLLASVAEGDRAIYSATHTDLMVTLTAMAAQTQRVALGSLVMVLPFRHPVPLAKAAASLDLLSHGRLILGAGSGWNAAEFAALDVPRGERAGRMEETVELLRRLWTGERVTFRGRYFTLEDVAIAPTPPSPGPPIWLGSFLPARSELDTLPARLDRVVARVGRLADGWVPVVYSQLTKRSVSPQVLGRVWERVKEHASAAGRPRGVELAFSHWFYVIDNAADQEAARAALAAFFNGTFEQARETYLVGAPEEIADKVRRILRDVRDDVSWMIFSTIHADTRQLDLLCDKVLPLLGLELRPAAAQVSPPTP